MTTLSAVIAQVRHRLQGVDTYDDQVGELTSDIDATGTAIGVLGLDNPTPGVYEIDFEKVRVRSTSNGGLQAFSFGRGYGGTLAVPHAQGAMVTQSPMFPASTILAEVNSVLGEIYPSLYSVVHYSPTDEAGTPVGYRRPFLMPNDCRGIIAVHVRDELTGAWVRVERYRWNPSAERQLDLGVNDGATVRVTYAQEPGRFVNEPTGDEDWADSTRLPERYISLVTLGVAARLAPFMDFARLGSAGMEARNDQGRQVGQGVQVGRAFLAEFQAGIQREQAALYRENPVRYHRER